MGLQMAQTLLHQYQQREEHNGSRNLRIDQKIKLPEGKDFPGIRNNWILHVDFPVAYTMEA